LKATEADSDERLLVEAARKDPSRFGDLYERHFEYVYAFVAGRVGGRQEAEDVTSDVFRRALAYMPRYEWRGVPFGVWLRKIASNAIADRWKSAAREHDAAAFLEVAAANPESPSDRIAEVYRLVDQLPEDQRRVVRMRFAEEMSVRQIARAIGRTEGAVKQLQFRALQSLRVRLGPHNG
jgi:RNA polymerase sigma-70 factor, ECF subfamily